jgi:hypothetical protein
MALRSQYFTTKTSKGGDYFKTGLMLFSRKVQIGTIAQYKETDKYVFFSAFNSVVKEFDSFSEADLWAWCHAPRK